MSTQKSIILCLLFMIMGILLTACSSAPDDATITPTVTPRPAFVLNTPTPTAPVTPEITPTAIPTPTTNPRIRPTATPTLNPRVTPSPSPNPSATPIVLTPAPSITPRPSRAIGGDLVSARDRDPTTLHPYGLNDAVSKEYRSLLYDAKLLKRNSQTLEWESYAASAFKYDDKALTVSFMLRRNMRWSDGAPITTDDFIWTYQYITDPDRGWIDLPLYAGKIESYFAPDKYTLQVKLRDRYSNPLEIANLVEPLPKHRWDGQSWSEPEINREINRPTAVSGAWKLKEWRKDDRIIFVRNELSACSPVPNINSLTFLRADSKNALELLQKGDIDFYTPPTPADFETVKQMAKIVPYHWNPASPTWQYLGFNFRNSLWQNSNVRKALSSAVNRADMVKDIADNLAVPLYSDIAPGNPAYTDNVEKPVYSLESAQALLLSAGYRLNGYRLGDPNGKDLPEINLIYNNESEFRTRLASYLASQFEKLGFKVKLTPLEYQTFLNTLQDPKADFDLYLSAWKSNTFNPEQFGTIWNNPPGGYRNQQLISLYSNANSVVDKTLRMELLNQIQQLEAKELPYLYLYANQDYAGVAAFVGGVTESPLGIAANHYADWYIR
ncbi:MAG: hypothetical protein HXX08_10455 [Chloroflexi bacterium]|uniref:ABC transporter substrate-binding protein n=1 Tax=Candidatus Chlorohelix allophototropha TaxID=3003348 RepID=A0A8T7M3A6_9CHLR|nr:hypothetical protein [Chloroflexota bacterium]WJW65658.1 ABC transporter substrate-binding protein [Chloroflexota bacterium L227-S17]